MLRNSGRGIAEDVFASFYILGDGGPNCSLEIDWGDHTIWQAQFSFGIHVSGITRPGFRLPPEGNLMAATFHWTVRPPFNKKFGFQGTYGGSNSTSGQLFSEATPQRLQQAYDLITVAHDIEAAKDHFIKLVLPRAEAESDAPDET
jgi:hypothetical protein